MRRPSIPISVSARSLLVALALGCDGPAPADAGTDAQARDAGADAGARPAIVPAETADEDFLRRLAVLDELPVLGGPRLAQRSSEDRLGGGPVSSTLFENGNRDMNHFVCRGDGADVRDPNLLEVRYDLPRCPEPWVRGAVLARFEGSGALVRLWMTIFSIRDRAPDRERLLIYVDGDESPRIDVPLGAALDGSASPIFAPPFGAGSRGHLAWSYPVVFASRLIVALDGVGPLDLVYHQSTVALDEAPVARAAPDAPLASLREEARRSLSRVPDGGTPASARITLAPGEPIEALVLDGPATIHELAVRAETLDALDGVVVRVRWDDAPAHAIELPLLELFAAALDAPEPAGPLLGAVRGADLTLALRLPMPFSSRAQIELEGTVATSFELSARTTPGVPSAPFGRLHVERNETLGPTGAPMHPLARAAGPGHLAGVCLLMEGRTLESAGLLAHPLNFLEGDERITADDAILTGTGTEDYLDSAFYFSEGAFATPFAQAWGATSADMRGHVSGCRWHVRTHAIHFERALDAELEIGPGTPSVLERYRSVAYLYR